MSGLTPEERQKIYLEEKARLEVRRELEGQKTGAGTIILYIVLGVVGLLVVIFVIGSVVQESDDAAFRSLTPEQRHQKTLQSCANLLKSMEYKTYNELSEFDRRVKVTCSEQLAHPDQYIITDH